MKEKSILEYMSVADGDIENICAEIFFLYLKENSEAYNNFRLFLEKWFDIESVKSMNVKSYYPKENYQECYNDIGSIVERLLSNLVEKNYSAETFYNKLWDSINSDCLFDSELEKICAILFVLLSPKIPYFQMGEALRMDDEEYWHISHEVEQPYKKAVFALNRGYEQRTEVASQIIGIFKEIKDEKQQIVYVSKLIGYCRYKIKNLEEIIEDMRSTDDTHND